MRPQLHCTVENHSKPIPRSRSSGFHSKFVQREQVLQVALLVQIVSLFACSTARNASTQCYVWSNHTPSEMCALSPEDRVQRFRATFLFADLQPISLHSVFSAGSRGDSWSRRLLSGVRGTDCVRGTGSLCSACFDRLAGALRQLDDAYRSFDQTLFRFDCMPAVDTASATRPFSPNGSCTTCRSWYKRWLLVQTISIWREPPCVNWCYYAQLACPHLATSKVVDYAGHPSFQCRGFFF
ncbi:hypothetical protein GCK32_000596 [Trichostrongylus colubriformis]|uniref:Uncharacterized protein n=1 Tax=Trichostrongylus colubriformis TaxID=6319 RepID=A0AAN8IK58_TRICO